MTRAWFWNEVRDAVSLRTTVLIAGVLVLQLRFIVSYVGAFHAPKPHRIPVAVAAPAQSSARLIGELNDLRGSPLRAAPADAQAARRQVTAGTRSAALIVSPRERTDRLLLASGGGVSVSTAVQDVLTTVDAHRGRRLAISDVVPLQSGDARGLSGFYLVVGWIVGGYLVASLLGVAKGTRPANLPRAIVRMAALAIYAVVSGLTGALLVGPLLGALTGHVVALWWLGALLVFAAAAATLAFQILFGILGIGVTILLFVVLGNPSAGGAYQPALLPAFWRDLSNVLPNGAGTQAVRQIIYFHDRAITGHLLVIAAYALAGAVVAIIGSTLPQRRPALLGEPTEGNWYETRPATVPAD